MTYDETDSVITELDKQIKINNPKAIILSYDLYNALKQAGRIQPANTKSPSVKRECFASGTLDGTIPVTLENLPTGTEFRLIPPSEQTAS